MMGFNLIFISIRSGVYFENLTLSCLQRVDTPPENFLRDYGFGNMLYPCGVMRCNHCHALCAFNMRKSVYAVRTMKDGGEPLYGGGMTCADCVDRDFYQKALFRATRFVLYAREEALVRGSGRNILTFGNITVTSIPNSIFNDFSLH